MRFTGSIDGAVIFDRAFNRIDKLSDLRPLWPEVIATFYDIEFEQFETEGAASGERFDPLSTLYSEWKEHNYPGQPILQAEGDLMESLTDPEAAGAVLIPREDELVIGTSVPYARVHQRGSARRNIPARPPIRFAEAQRRRMQKAIQSGLVRFIRETGIAVEERNAA